MLETDYVRENDIFVSYAHVDNEILPGAEQGWVTTFIKGLKVLLNQELGRRDAYKLWMDYELRGNKQVKPKIYAQLDVAKILLLFLSPGYIASSWCRDELTRFVKQAGSTEGHLFLVELTSVDERPQELTDLLGYQLWMRDDRNRQRTLAIPQPDPTQREYYDRLSDLASDLANQLKTLKPQLLAPSAEHKLTELTSSKPIDPTLEVSSSRSHYEDVVFVNAANDDLQLARQTAQYLATHGFGYCLPLSADENLEPTRVTARELRRDLQQNYKECDAVLMLYRDGPVEQLTGYMREWKKMNARRRKPARFVALCVHPKPDQQSIRFFLPNMVVLQTAEPCPQDCARQFIKAARP